MKHYFIINPAAGPEDSSIKLKEQIESNFKDKSESYEIYITKASGESYKIAHEVSNNLTEDTIFYACGGDGTCFDVINGIVGKPHAHFGIIPIGSCNDFLKTFRPLDFKNVENVSCGGYKDYCVSKLKIPSLTIEVGSDNLLHPIDEKHLDEIFYRHKNIAKDLKFSYNVFNQYKKLLFNNWIYNSIKR